MFLFKHRILLLLLLPLTTVLLYCFITNFYSLFPLQTFSYFNNYNHYIADPRASGQKFNLLLSLAPADAQWYLKIADSGYPIRPRVIYSGSHQTIDGATYAFFPLYPITIALVNFFLKNIVLSAFILTQLLFLLNIVSLYYVIKKLYNEQLAIKTLFLLFLFPFSIFFRSYFSESLFLLELIWFSYFLIKKRLFISSLLLGLLLVTRGNGLFLLPVFFCVVFRDVQNRRLFIKKSILYGFILILPFLAWIAYCYLQTGNGFYFIIARKAWFQYPFPLPLFYNIALVLLVRYLPFHFFHLSQLDVFFVVLDMILLVFSKKFLRPVLWWVAFTLWISPLSTQDAMSSTRFQIIYFPLFIYAAYILKGRWYLATLVFFSICLLIVSLLFVNWYWIG